MRYQSACKHIDAGKPLIIVWEYKHGSTYHLATTIAELDKIALWHIKNRIENNYIFNPDVDEPRKPSMNEEEVLKLPDGVVQRTAIAEQNAYKQLMQRWQDRKLQWAALNNAIATSNAEVAWQILSSRCNYEYENMEAVIPNKVE